MMNDNKLNDKESSDKPHDVQKIQSMTLAKLYTLMDQHKEHLKFLKENDMLSDTDKIEIVERVKEMYDVISKRNSDATIMDNTSNSRSVS